MDPQSSLEVLAGLGFDTPPERTVSRLLMPEEFGDDGELLETVVHETPWAAALVPASKALATAERALGEPGRGGANQRLRRGLERLEVDERFDVVLIDCPPGMTPLTMNALVAASHVLVPTQLDFLSVAGLARADGDGRGGPRVRQPAAALSRDRRHPGRRAHPPRPRDPRAARAAVRRPTPAACCAAATIRHSTRVRDAHAARLAVGQFDPEHPVSDDYRELAAELAIRARLGSPLEAVAMTAAKRHDAGAAVAGLFDRPSATGGLAGAARSTETPRRGPVPDGRSAPASSRTGVNAPVAGESRVRLGVELSERETAFLRPLSRPARTGWRRPSRS